MIQLFKVRMPPSVLDPLRETLFSGYIGQGPKVEEFERQLGVRFGNKRVLTTNSGTSAIQLALMLARVGPGDEVIVSPMTCSASCMPILMSEAKIVWSDIRADGNIDPVSVWQQWTPRTKAVIAVHWGGYPCDLDKLNSICEEFGGKLIEDAAHAFGASYRGEPIGSISDFSCFSFQAIKHLTTIDGGALTCRDEADYKRGKLLRWYGIDRECKRQDFRCEADIVEAGTKWHLSDACATIGIEQLKTVDQVLTAHRENAAYYRGQFATRGIKYVCPLDYADDRLSSYWLFTVLADDRDGFVKWMNEHGVMCSRVHQRNDIHTYAKPYYSGPLPGVDYFAAHEACIPVGWWLTWEDRETVMGAIEEWDKTQNGR